MSGLFRSSGPHDRAQELAAWRLDGLLEPDEEAWLDGHLAACARCAAAAAEYATDHQLLQGLRDVAPEPPRDLWARTAAALEAEGAGPAVVPTPAWHGGGRLAWVLAPVAGISVVAIVVGSGLLNGQPPTSPGLGVALPTPMAVTANIRVLNRGADGNLEIRTQNVAEVCPVGAGTCIVEASGEAQPLAAIDEAPSVSAAILSPSGDRLVIVQGGKGTQGVYVVPIASAVAATAGPAGTAEPVATIAATNAPSVEPPSQVVPASTPDPSMPVESATPVVTATDGPSASPEPDASATPDGSPSTSPTSEPSPGDPSADPSSPPATSPEPTPTPEETLAPSPTIEVTPGPDGALQIASDVVLVGPVSAYNKAGTRFAFSARPADGSHGPDVYVWRTSEPRARAVTTDHRSVFAGWHSGDLVVSRVGDGSSGTYLVDPTDGSETGPVSDGWLPTISPNQRTAVWWDGGVRFADDGVTPVTGNGRLVLGSWEREGAVQELAAGKVGDSQVRWDPDGRVLAVWKPGADPSEAGALSLYRVEPGGRSVDTADPILDNVPAFAGFALDTDHLAWPARGDDGKRVVRVFAWNDDGEGIVEFPSDDGGTIIH